MPMMSVPARLWRFVSWALISALVLQITALAEPASAASTEANETPRSTPEGLQRVLRARGWSHVELEPTPAGKRIVLVEAGKTMVIDFRCAGGQPCLVGTLRLMVPQGAEAISAARLNSWNKENPLFPLVLERNVLSYRLDLDLELLPPDALEVQVRAWAANLSNLWVFLDAK